jgi:hypothetical protein
MIPHPDAEDDSEEPSVLRQVTLTGIWFVLVWIGLNAIDYEDRQTLVLYVLVAATGMSVLLGHIPKRRAKK